MIENINSQPNVLPKTAHTSTYRDYKIKIYLNAWHYIFNNGKAGEKHPHSWEFAVYMRFPATKFFEFKDLEEPLIKFIEPYQNQVLNDLEPFDTMIPTLENIADYFATEMNELIYKMNGVILQMSASETPTKTYIVNMDTNEALCQKSKDFEAIFRKELVNAKLQSIMRDMI